MPVKLKKKVKKNNTFNNIIKIIINSEKNKTKKRRTTNKKLNNKQYKTPYIDESKRVKVTANPAATSDINKLLPILAKLLKDNNDKNSKLVYSKVMKIEEISDQITDKLKQLEFNKGDIKTINNMLMNGVPINDIVKFFPDFENIGKEAQHLQLKARELKKQVDLYHEKENTAKLLKNKAEDELRDLEKDKAISEKQRDDLIDELNIRIDELNELKNKNAESEKQRNDLKEELKKLENDKAISEKQRDDLIDVLNIRIKELNKLENDKAMSEKQRDDLTNKLNKLDNDFKNNKTKYEETITKMNDVMKGARNKIKDVKAIYKEAEQKTIDYEKKEYDINKKKVVNSYQPYVDNLSGDERKEFEDNYSKYIDKYKNKTVQKINSSLEKIGLTPITGELKEDLVIRAATISALNDLAATEKLHFQKRLNVDDLFPDETDEFKLDI